jgi:hypothetical protein
MSKLKLIAINWVVKNLLKSITEEDVLRPDKKGGIIYRGRTLSKEMCDRLQDEAEMLENSYTLKFILEDMEYLANKTMFEKSSKFDDLLFGKAMLYTIDVLKKKIHNLAK